MAIGEVLVRQLGLDYRLLVPLLYYQGADKPVHRLSRDVSLHYELDPNAKADFGAGRLVSINSFGFRDRERNQKKPSGVFRIFCIGASNTYGAAVSDDQTYPRQLERLLDRKYSGSFEVWNAGVSAYVLSQNVEIAETILREYSPDLLIFQLSNYGRRPFLWGQPFARYFEEDPALYAENLRFLPFRYSAVESALMAHWRFYRASILGINRLWLSAFGPAVPIFPEEDEFNQRSFRRFYEEYERKLPILLLVPPGIVSLDESLRALNVKTIDLRNRLPRVHESDYEKIHPPGYVYSWYAREIMSSLEAYGLIPADAASRASDGLAGR
jgi:hypothetical protein